jgi:flagellar motor switch protein FliN
MNNYLECWISVARSLFSQALAGEHELVEDDRTAQESLSGVAFAAFLTGDVKGKFTVALDPLIVEAPLLGDGIEQTNAWEELLREVAEAAAGELLAVAGKKCSMDSFSTIQPEGAATRIFRLVTAEKSWSITVRDQLESNPGTECDTKKPLNGVSSAATGFTLNPGVELLLDVELEAALRFGCCEMPLGEILELGPGDVIELDRHVADTVDLVVGNKIVAKGDVVLINGNFGLRVTEVAEPQKRLESIRCLF